jgi:hypothetical protein
VGPIHWNYQEVQNLAKAVPLKFNTQRKVRFNGGHTLFSLLQTNEHALCKDSRDKIYGLIGLAIDVHDRFPIDYSKSLFEVFTDTIYFLNSDESRSQHDILGMSRLVGRMLGRAVGLEPDGPVRDFSAGDIAFKSTAGSLCVPGRLVGRIKETGRLYCDVVAKTDKLNEWVSLVWRNILEPPMRSTVLGQGELFLKAL